MLVILFLLLLIRIVMPPESLHLLGLPLDLADRVGRHLQRAGEWLGDLLPRKLSSRGKKTKRLPRDITGSRGHRGPPPPDPQVQPPKVHLVPVDPSDPLWLDAISRLLAFGRVCRQRRADLDHAALPPDVGPASVPAPSPSVAPSSPNSSPLSCQGHHA